MTDEPARPGHQGPRPSTTEPRPTAQDATGPDGGPSADSPPKARHHCRTEEPLPGTTPSHSPLNPASRDGGRGRLRLPLTRVVLGALALAVFAAPFAAAWQYEAGRRTVSAQVPAPGREADARPRAEAARTAAAPVVLAYHDIAPRPRGRYTLTPERLDAQLSALAAAGYRTLSTAEFTEFLATGRTPAPRTVHLTFDDGTRGLWAYADPVLARHGMRAAAYLITGAVDTHRPYYLSWSEIGRMADSGRWDFQDHTHLAHRRAPVDGSGRPGSVLANRLWLPGERRLESAAEYRARVERDLDRSLGAFADHGLPRPRLFAYPYSETGGATNQSDGRTTVLRELLADRFTATLTNTTSRPLPAGPRAAAAGQVRRLEVLGSTTPGGLLRALADWTTLAPGDVPRPLRRPGQWRDANGGPAGTAALTGAGPETGTYASAAHLPLATAGWRTYRVAATADRLRGTGTGVSVEVGHGSLEPCVITLGANGLRVTQRRDGARPVVTVRRLDPARQHRLAVEVSPRAVRITVDGEVSLKVRVRDGARPARTDGGLALAVRNDAPDTAWPRFTSLRVSP
ncbi:polysaccharide deacetylase family protein [Streptomyces sp. NPDC000983]|uniref:polysaccharide deacetylase family protein n=1 Tax=Streptomyces sp. NPDC000983 TaxID=3154373 RepID=UPI00331A3520